MSAMPCQLPVGVLGCITRWWVASEGNLPSSETVVLWLPHMHWQRFLLAVDPSANEDHEFVDCRLSVAAINADQFELGLQTCDGFIIQVFALAASCVRIFITVPVPGSTVC